MPIRYILTDIEGTTTSIHFVHEVLFPYAAAHMPAWLEAHAHEPRVRGVIGAVKGTVAAEEERVINDAEALRQLLQWIKDDRKHPALKTIQGWLWKEGYESGAYKSHIYPDVKSAFERWKEAGINIGVYSSGSMEAQVLLFGYTEVGDLRPFLSDYFDTSVGHKREAKSYRNISTALGLPAAEILFLSDVPEELDAAVEAGMQVRHLVRQGTKAVERYVGVADFGGI